MLSNLVPRVLSILRESTFSRKREDPGNEVEQGLARSTSYNLQNELIDC